MHLIGADLDLKGLARTADQCSVKGLVHIRLRHGNIVFKTAGNGLIHLMDHAQGCITVLHRLHHDPNRKQIINLVQGLVLLHHLLINAEEMLHPSPYGGVDACLLHMLPDLVHNRLYKGLSGVLAKIHFLHQVIIYLRMKKF